MHQDLPMACSFVSVRSTSNASPLSSTVYAATRMVPFVCSKHLFSCTNQYSNTTLVGGQIRRSISLDAHPQATPSAAGFLNEVHHIAWFVDHIARFIRQQGPLLSWMRGKTSTEKAGLFGYPTPSRACRLHASRYIPH